MVEESVDFEPVTVNINMMKFRLMVDFYFFIKVLEI